MALNYGEGREYCPALGCRNIMSKGELSIPYTQTSKKLVIYENKILYGY